MDSLKCQLWPHPSPYEASKVAPGGAQTVPPLSPLPISPLFFSHNKSGPDFPKQTALWGPSPPITLCQFQSGLKYDSTVCASRVSPFPPPPHLHVIPTIAPSSLNDPFAAVAIRGRPNRSGLAAGAADVHGAVLPVLTKPLPPVPVPPKTQTGDPGPS